jgi:peptide/nickel transport system substrate-binding protein
MVLHQIWQFFTTEGLTSRGPDGRPLPRIAESWDVSPDGLTWRITVRRNVFFHDGSPVDAAAVKTVLDREVSTPGIGELYPGLVDVRGLTTDGSHTLVVDLKRPSAFLVEDLDMPLTKPSADNTQVGTGPYYPLTTSNTEARFKAHDKYYLGSPQIREVVFKSYPTLRQAWASLLRGEIDVVSNVSGDALEFVAGEAVQTFSFTRHYAYVIAFNSARPQFRSAAV